MQQCSLQNEARAIRALEMVLVPVEQLQGARSVADVHQHQRQRHRDLSRGRPVARQHHRRLEVRTRLHEESHLPPSEAADPQQLRSRGVVEVVIGERPGGIVGGGCGIGVGQVEHTALGALDSHTKGS